MSAETAAVLISPSDRTLRRLAYAAVAVSVALEAATPAAGAGIGDLPGVHGPVYEPLQVALGLVWCPVALVLVLARPRNPIGWLLMSVPLTGSVQNFGGAYGTHAFARPGDGLPLGSLAISLGSSMWTTALFLPLTLMVVRYPSGALPGPRWRWLDRAVAACLVATAVGLATAPDSVDDWIATARPVVALPGRLAVVLVVAGGLGLVGATALVLGHAGWRTWRARGPERAQLLLLVLTGAVTVVCAFAPWGTLFSVTLFLVPIAVAVGVLRYKLLGIEVVVRRTLLYGTLTAVVAGVYAAVVALLSPVVPSGPAPGVVAAAVVAVGLLPARARLQALVDVVVYGERRDPVAAVTRLGAQLPDDDPLPSVVTAVARSLRSRYVAVTASDGRIRAASAAAPDREPVTVPLRRGGRELGALLVAQDDGERLDATDRRLLEALAVQVAAVVHAVDLGDDLAAARERTVAAALAERSRLRHDLHDGLGPSLTGIGLGLEAVDVAVCDDPARARAVVARLREEVVAAVEDVRRILDGLRPPALDEIGLVRAVQARAAVLTDRTAGRLRVEVEVDDPLPHLDPETETAAFRIAEEALTNTVRHSGARRVVVRLAQCGGRLEVEVRDDGRGLPAVPSQGVGLESMHRRAEALGGSLAVTSGAGVRVLARLPVEVGA